jgi:hypothetical protein
LEILGKAGASESVKRVYQQKLNEIVCACKLSIHVEDEETPACKAEAFQRAVLWERRRQRALACIRSLWPWDELLNELLDTLPADLHAWPYRENIERALAQSLVEHLKETGVWPKVEEAVRILRNRDCLPAALEQEAARLQSKTEGRSLESAFIELRDRYRGKSRPGLNESRALRNTIHALQAFASGVNEKFHWGERRSPPELIPFLLAVLDAAKIKHPSYEASPDRFRSLMLGHRERLPKALATSDFVPLE